MPIFFIIKKLENEYCWQDFTMDEIAYEYASDIHNIPSQYIENIDVFIGSQRVEITLCEDKSIVKEDWYQLLLRYTEV